MSSKKKRKQRKPVARKQSSKPPNTPIQPTYPPPITQSRSLGSLIWKIFLGIVVIVGFFLTCSQVYDRCKSKQRKLADEVPNDDLKPPRFNTPRDTLHYTILEHAPTFITRYKENTRYNENKYPKVKGILLKYVDSGQAVVFAVGLSAAVIPLKALYRGVVLHAPSRGGCDTTDFMFGVLDDRLYVSTEFKNLQTGETAGKIEYNHWELYKPNFLSYKNNDESLEVKDKQSYTMFTLKYVLGHDSLNSVYIGGYFISPRSISIFTNFWKGGARIYDTCYGKNDTLWKEKAEMSISRLLPIFDH